MLTAVVLLCLISFSYGGAARVPLQPRLGGRIVGGTSASISDFPYQLSLQANGDHWCGAVVVSAMWALTAAHCFTQAPAGATFTLRAGSSTRNSGGEVYEIAIKFSHPNFGDNGMDSDIALIRACTLFNLGSNIAIIALPSLREAVDVGTNAVATGWGATTENGTEATTLQQVTLPVISNSDCNTTYGGGITKNMLCAGYTDGGKDVCQGDSGGPLVADGKLIGIISFGHGCARPNFPGVYTWVAAYRSWIGSNCC